MSRYWWGKYQQPHADDTVLLANSEENLQAIINRLINFPFLKVTDFLNGFLCIKMMCTDFFFHNLRMCGFFFRAAQIPQCKQLAPDYNA